MSQRGLETYDYVLKHGPVTSLDICRAVGSVTPGRCVFEMERVIPCNKKLLKGRTRVQKANGAWVWVKTYKIVRRRALYIG